MSEKQLLTIPIIQIRENPVALRGVNKTGEAFMGLVDSIKRIGVMNAITVTPKVDPNNKQEYYQIVDGLHRYMAACEAGLKEIPAQVMNLTEAQGLEAQLMANVHKVETRPVEYSKQLLRILSANPTMTASELSARLGKSPGWVGERLGLLKLDDNIAKIVNDNKMSLSNAYAIAKLEGEEQKNFIDRAMTMTPQEFVPLVEARVKQIREARRQGKDSAPAEFVAVPHLQKLAILKSEFEKPTILPALLKKQNVTSALEAAKLALAWVLHMDAMSIEQAKAQEAQRQKEREEAAKRREAEKAAKKAKDAAKEQDAAKAAPVTATAPAAKA